MNRAMTSLLVTSLVMTSSAMSQQIKKTSNLVNQTFQVADIHHRLDRKIKPNHILNSKFQRHNRRKIWNKDSEFWGSEWISGQFTDHNEETEFYDLHDSSWHNSHRLQWVLCKSNNLQVKAYLHSKGFRLKSCRESVTLRGFWLCCFSLQNFKWNP